MTPRRYRLLKRFAARRQCREEETWKALQEELPGTALPAEFPHLSRLAEAGYSTTEDLEDACHDELDEFAGLTQHEADQVIAALAELAT